MGRCVRASTHTAGGASAPPTPTTVHSLARFRRPSAFCATRSPALALRCAKPSCCSTCALRVASKHGVTLTHASFSFLQRPARCAQTAQGRPALAHAGAVTHAEPVRLGAASGRCCSAPRRQPGALTPPPPTHTPTHTRCLRACMRKGSNCRESKRFVYLASA